MKNDPQYVKAAELADRYIETILHSKPELLIGEIEHCEFTAISQVAKKVTELRLQLMNGLKEQPLPADYEPKDDAA